MFKPDEEKSPMQTSGALTVDQEPFSHALSKAARPDSGPQLLGGHAPVQPQAPSHPPKGHLLFLDPARRSSLHASLGASEAAEIPLPGPSETQGRAPSPPGVGETLRASLHLYAGRSQAKC